MSHSAVTIEGLTLYGQTPKGMQVGFDADSTFWLPRSQVIATDLEDEGDEGYVEIPKWLAEKEELLDDADGGDWLND